MQERQVYTVVAYDKDKNEIDRIDNVRAWNRREAYFEVMHDLKEHKTWDAGTSL